MKIISLASTNLLLAISTILPIAGCYSRFVLVPEELPLKQNFALLEARLVCTSPGLTLGSS